eukprot:m.4748 g.4748  ORF g.4748 m.4748 type:complete len:550 (+) comp11217_c0_seq1:48-1697(+)
MDSNNDDDVECELMLEALHHQLEQVENRLERLLEETDAPNETPEELEVKKEVAQDETTREKSQPLKASTLPPILHQYTAAKSTNGDVSLKTRRRRETEVLRQAEEEEKKREGERQKRERNMALFERLEALKEIVREDYLNALEEKVDRQRAKLKERAKREERREQIAEKRKERRRKKKPRQPRSDGTSDWSFLAHVSATKFYQLVEIEYEMKRDGRPAGDMKELWNKMLPLPPSKEQQVLKIMPPEKPRRDNSHPTSVIPSPLPVFLENDEPANSWAMTDVPNSMLKSDATQASKSSPSGVTFSLENLEKKFPKNSLPPLKSFHHSLVPTCVEFQTNPDEDKHRQIYKERKETRKKKVKMYRHAIANHLATARIMKEHQDLFRDDLPSLRAEEAFMFLNSDGNFPPSFPVEARLLTRPSAASPSPPPPDSAQDKVQPRRSRSESQESELSLTSGSWETASSSRWDTVGLTTDTSGHSLAKVLEDRRMKRKEARARKAAVAVTRVSEEPAPGRNPPPAIPLSMDSLHGNDNIVVLESKAPSAMWTNYLKA